MTLNDNQVALLRDVAAGELTSVRINGAGTLSVDGHHWRTFDSLLGRGLVDMADDRDRFWKKHVSLTDEGAALLLRVEAAGR